MNPRKLTQRHRIRFAECDPAGIVFYPQYFVMFNNLMEAWIDGLLPGGFAGYIGKHRFGLPTVRLEADFRSISRMGDDVELSLEVIRLGGKSLTLSLSCMGGDGEVRMSVTQVVVSTSLDTHQAIDIPAMLREALTLESINE
ncbi:acyl-CoA thioesterase [Trinickia dinghuensis]|uniref:Acyl-CoA thioesterase n=1 Tax=Trinickia dinghuensis TaxID=2291023 RepID=A0A3D8K677_9BURK|nr:thioesterase family protein [Trinickia dinghuensis]RDV00387.1 acyl-CoA thioesterase [Trinickia dinghuensis]